MNLIALLNLYCYRRMLLQILLVVDGPVAKDLSSLIARLQILYTSLKVINLENNVD